VYNLLLFPLSQAELENARLVVDVRHPVLELAKDSKNLPSKLPDNCGKTSFF